MQKSAREFSHGLEFRLEYFDKDLIAVYIWRESTNENSKLIATFKLIRNLSYPPRKLNGKKVKLTFISEMLI